MQLPFIFVVVAITDYIQLNEQTFYTGVIPFHYNTNN